MSLEHRGAESEEGPLRARKQREEASAGHVWDSLIGKIHNGDKGL